MNTLSESERRLALARYFRYLRQVQSADTPERRDAFLGGWVEGGASALRRSAELGAVMPRLTEFLDLLRAGAEDAA